MLRFIAYALPVLTFAVALIGVVRERKPKTVLITLLTILLCLNIGKEVLSQRKAAASEETRARLTTELLSNTQEAKSAMLLFALPGPETFAEAESGAGNYPDFPVPQVVQPDFRALQINLDGLGRWRNKISIEPTRSGLRVFPLNRVPYDLDTHDDSPSEPRVFFTDLVEPMPVYGIEIASRMSGVRPTLPDLLQLLHKNSVIGTIEVVVNNPSRAVLARVDSTWQKLDVMFKIYLDERLETAAEASESLPASGFRPHLYIDGSLKKARIERGRYVWDIVITGHPEFYLKEDVPI